MWQVDVWQPITRVTQEKPAFFTTIMSQKNILSYFAKKDSVVDSPPQECDPKSVDEASEIPEACSTSREETDCGISGSASTFNNKSPESFPQLRTTKILRTCCNLRIKGKGEKRILPINLPMLFNIHGQKHTAG